MVANFTFFYFEQCGSELKTSEAHFHLLKEKPLGSLKEAIHQEVAEILLNMTLGFFVNL